ncbi:phage baseplate assembly protein V [Streptomyces werraensis]|uniref:phage baseplate assembly protein V n=1 Tax=Streptomyces werraensis TaxID=68284 RepID=UPI003435E8F7
MTAVYGVYAGLVVSADDPQGQRRVKLRIPQLTGGSVSGWAEPVGYGIAEPGDRVTVAFEGGDLNFPVYWPRAVSTWRPLDLEPGWSASWQGSPAYRVTQDGMVELSGSVETSTAIPLGEPVRVGVLPLGARPFEGVQGPAATSYRAAYNAQTVFAENRATITITSTTYVTQTGGPSLDFIAPGTGSAVVLFGAFMQSATDVGRCIMSVRVSQGSTVIADGDDNRSAEVQGPDNVTAAGSRLLTGLAPGQTYNVAALYRTDNASATASFDNKWLTVIPIGDHDTPAARVQVQNNGVIAVTFPAGAAPPYDVSLTGIRARIA